MVQAPQELHRPSIVDELENLASLFERSLRSERKADRTIETYMAAVDQFVAHLASQPDAPAQVGDLRRGHIESFVADLAARTSAATVANRFRALKRFFGYLEEEGDVDPSPMRKMREPKVVVQPVEPFTAQELRALLDACKGKSFEDRRDKAIVWLLTDTGMRVAELTALKLSDLSLGTGTDLAFVLGKGERLRACPFDNECASALQRYLLARGAHPQAARADRVWLGRRGPMTENGIRQMLERRAAIAGVPNVHPHRFRHTWGHRMMAKGAYSEGDIQQLGGWRSQAMLRRYGSSAATERAINAYRRTRLNDDL